MYLIQKQLIEKCKMNLEIKVDIPLPRNIYLIRSYTYMYVKIRWYSCGFVFRITAKFNRQVLLEVLHINNGAKLNRYFIFNLQAFRVVVTS